MLLTKFRLKLKPQASYDPQTSLLVTRHFFKPTHPTLPSCQTSAQFAQKHVDQIKVKLNAPHVIVGSIMVTV